MMLALMMELRQENLLRPHNFCESQQPEVFFVKIQSNSIYMKDLYCSNATYWILQKGLKWKREQKLSICMMVFTFKVLIWTRTKL